jgi:hypothetical protein
MHFWNKLYRVQLLRCTNIYRKQCNYMFIGDCRDRDRMVVICTTTYAISAYHHYRCEHEFRAWRGVFDTLLCCKTSLKIPEG